MNKKGWIIIVTFIIGIVISSIIYYRFNRQKNLLETRLFNVFNPAEYELHFHDEFNNPFLLWNDDGTRELGFQPFSDWKLFVHKQVPETLEIDDCVYFPKSFKAEFPMYYENETLKRSYFPTPNSMIVVTEPLTWIGDRNQVVVVGKKLNVMVS